MSFLIPRPSLFRPARPADRDVAPQHSPDSPGRGGCGMLPGSADLRLMLRVPAQASGM